MTSKKDDLFSKPAPSIQGFEFNEEVAACFDDMVARSIPFYREIHQLILDLVGRTEAGKGPIVDLGCSTGTTLAMLAKELKRHQLHPQLIGVDASAPMIEKAREKFSDHEIPEGQFQLYRDDLRSFSLPESQFVIMNYTLQFIPQEDRPKLLKNIYQSLKPGGIFLISEKIKSPSHKIQELTTELYYDFKRRNGYSELEISQKREALEKVLSPVTPEKQLQLLKQSGFSSCEMIFRWYNFASYLGIK